MNLFFQKEESQGKEDGEQHQMNESLKN